MTRTLPNFQRPISERERAEIWASHRGRDMGGGLVRNFCGLCGLPLKVPPELGDKTDLRCEEHAERGGGPEL